MKKFLAIVCTIACIMLVLCSCEPNNAAENTANYGTFGVYYEHYNLDGGYTESTFSGFLSYLFSSVDDDSYDNTRDYNNKRTVGDFVIADHYSDYNNSDGVCILYYKGKSTDVVIPEQLDGKDVVALGAYDFDEYTCVVLPFRETGFRSITLPSTLKYIYEGALTCSNAVFVSKYDTKNKLVLPESINVDPDNEYFSSENGMLFSKDKSCLLSVPAGIKCDTIDLRNNVKYVAKDAIICENVKNIYIGKDVVGINYPSYIFSKKLEQITVDDENEVYSSKDGVLFNKDKTILLNYPSMKQDICYTLPDSVDKVAANWGYVLKTEEIIFNENIDECHIYERPYADSDYNAEGIAWYSSIKKIYGYRGSGFSEAVFNISTEKDIDYEYLD